MEYAMNELSAELHLLAENLANVQAEKDKAAQRVNELKDQIKGLLGTLGPGDYQAGPYVIKATVARTINPARVAQTYPIDVHPYLYELKPDTKKVRAHLNEAQLEDLFDVSDLRITVKGG